MDLALAGIRKEFGGASALRGIDLDIRSGELLALLGPSGSGKTTLLRVIAGLEHPEAGSVRFGPDDATSLPVRRRGVGFVFQHYALFRHLTVADNIAFGLRARGRARPSRAAIAERVSELLHLVQLEGLGARRPHQLSGGQRQRVALARALAVDPKVLLLDEPFGALDAKVRRDLRRSLREIHDATGQTTVFVTHDQDEALELADRVAILNEGRIEQVGTPDEVYDRPASAFVMSFVGDTSQLPAHVRDGRTEVYGAPVPADASGLPDGPARLFVRPTDLGLGAVGAGWPATVISLRRTAEGRRVECRLDGDGAVVEAALPPLIELQRGDSVSIQVAGGRAFSV